MQEQYCGWCGATTIGSSDGETWICGICNSGDWIPSFESVHTRQGL